MRKNRGFSAIVLIVILAVLALGGYWLWQKKAIAPTLPPTNGSPTSITSTSIKPTLSTPSVDMTNLSQ